MLNLRSKLTAVFLGIAGLTSSAQADCWDPCDPCNDWCIDFEIGADWLYWTPCINDQHFAIVFNDTVTPNRYKTHYFCDEWDSGVRVWGKIGNIWNGFSGYAAYTYFNPKTNGSAASVSGAGSPGDDVRFSYGIPAVYQGGESITSHWELDYQTLDAVLSYDINVSCNPCLSVEAFSGLTWVDVDQKRTDTLVNNLGEETVTFTFDRHNDYWAIGPTFGLNSSYRICDCLYLFGTMKTSLVVGESENKDSFSEQTGTAAPEVTEYHDKDECFCFPGLHLMAGIDYELSLCGCEFGIRLGWEYVQWINAPTFPFYEQNDEGIRSAPSTNDLTMQGIFVGLHASF